MHIAYLINHYPSVSHTFIRREIRALEAKGVQVDRFALRGWDSILVDPDDIAELERTKHTLRDGLFPLLLAFCRMAIMHPVFFWRGLRLAFSMSLRSVRPWPYHLIYLAHACKIMSWIDGQDVSHIHAHFGTNSTNIAALVKALGGPTYSFMIHGSEVFDDPTRHALPQKVKGASFVATSCAYIGSQLMYHIPPDLWSKVNIVHCGLPDAAFAKPPEPFPDHPVFLSIGRLSPEKGHLILLEAFANLHADHTDARLVIAGDGPLRDQVEDRIAALGLQDAVHITGWVTSAEVAAAVQNCRILVHPSFTEGLPVVIMEAMAGHRTVISTYIAGIPELVSDGETGWLVPAGQIQDLTGALYAATDLSNQSLQKMGDAAHARVMARHNVTTEAEKLYQLFSAGSDDHES